VDDVRSRNQSVGFLAVCRRFHCLDDALGHKEAQQVPERVS